MELDTSKRLATLGHPQRLDLFRLLMRRYPDHVPATELAQVLGVKPNTLSSYVSALMQVGLIEQERVGTSLRYAIDMAAARETVGSLLQDCCRGRPDLCGPSFDMDAQNHAPVGDGRYKVLFLCTGNSARSIFAETLLRDIAGDRFEAYSAGTMPRSALNPFAVKLLLQKGHDIAALRPKIIDAFRSKDAPVFDFVFTVCHQAANEDCPAWAGQPISANWGVPDPAQASGTDAEISLAFQRSYGALRNRIIAFTSLPMASLSRVALQHAVDDIARTPEGS